MRPLREALLIAVATLLGPSLRTGHSCYAETVRLSGNGIAVVVEATAGDQWHDAALAGVRRWLALHEQAVHAARRGRVFPSEEIRVRVELAGEYVQTTADWTADGWAHVTGSMRSATTARLAEQLPALLWDVLPWAGRIERTGGGKSQLVLNSLRDPQRWAEAVVSAPRGVISAGSGTKTRAWVLEQWHAGIGVCRPVPLWDDEPTGSAPEKTDCVVLPRGAVSITVRVHGSKSLPLPAADVGLLRAERAEGGWRLKAASAAVASDVGECRLIVPLDPLCVLEVGYAGLLHREPLGIDAAIKTVTLPVGRTHVIAAARCGELLRVVAAFQTQRRHLLDRLDHAARSGAVDDVERLLAAIEQVRVKKSVWHRELEEIRRAVSLPEGRRWELLQRTEEAVDIALQPIDLGPFRQWLQVRRRQQEVARLQRELSEHLESFRWEAARQSLRRLVELVPEDQAVREKLTRLDRLLRARDDEHATARAWLKQLMASADYEVLRDQIDVVQLQVEVLIRNRDVLTLLEFQRAAARWSEAIAARRRELAQKESATEADRAEVRLLVELAERLGELVRRAAAVTRGFRL